MSDDATNQLTAITFRLPAALREKIKAAAIAEGRSESGYIRFHLGQLVAMTEAETEVTGEE